MFMKTRRLLIDRNLKRKFSENKKLMIDRKKQKTERSYSLGNQVGGSKKLNVQDVNNGGEVLISGSCKSKKPLATDRKSKRKLLFTLRKAIRGRKKRKMKKVDLADEVVESVDRISELPEPIIHHIFSLLPCPRDVARTTVLSKKWRSIWASFFFFNFDQKKFKTPGKNHTEKFITFVDNSLATRLEPMHGIQKFKLCLSQVSTNLTLHMNTWVGAAINKDVKELEIHVEEKKRKHYMLPNTVLSAKRLTSLRLYGCKLDSNCVIDLCNLKELSIKNAYVNGDLIQSFIQGCPLVEDLRLVHCTGIGCLHISTLLKLSRVELHQCHGLKWVTIKLPSLVSFLHWGKEQWFSYINLTGCENLKYLTWKDPYLTEEMFQDMIANFPFLEKLVLRECDKLKQIIILSKRLKELSVIRCKLLERANIYAPNLSVLEYSGERMPFGYRTLAGLHEAKLHLKISKNRFLFCVLLPLLGLFENNGAWNLVVESNKDITIHEDLQKVQLLSSKDLKLELIKSPFKLKGYVENLLRLSRPKTLSLVSSSSSEFLKLVKRKIMSREADPKCCTYYTKKCWLHYVKDVQMVESRGAKIGEMSQNMQQTTFKFKWQS